MKMPSSPQDIFQNNAPAKGDILLSILIPFYHDDPAGLIRALQQQSAQEVELILYDDGSQDDTLHANIIAQITDIKMPARLIRAAQNHGRSHARNELVRAARGAYILFLDADMLPAQKQFLQTYIDEIRNNKQDIVFGGFLVEEQSNNKACSLHRALSKKSDCLPANKRNKMPAKHVCSSNLLVAKTVLDACPFDPEFVGWGWEDVEWAARANEQFTIMHIDNPAIHLGLESAETLVRRYRDSAENYARFVARHPALAQQLPSYRTAKLAGRIIGFTFLLPLFSTLARDPWHLVPMGVRILALKLWRAGWYAEKLA